MSPVLLEMNHHFAVLAEVWSASPTWLLVLRTLSLVLASLTSAALVSSRLGGIPKATALMFRLCFLFIGLWMLVHALACGPLLTYRLLSGA